MSAAAIDSRIALAVRLEKVLLPIAKIAHENKRDHGFTDTNNAIAHAVVGLGIPSISRSDHALIMVLMMDLDDADHGIE